MNWCSYSEWLIVAIFSSKYSVNVHAELLQSSVYITQHPWLYNWAGRLRLHHNKLLGLKSICSILLHLLICQRSWIGLVDESAISSSYKNWWMSSSAKRLCWCLLLSHLRCRIVHQIMVIVVVGLQDIAASLDWWALNIYNVLLLLSYRTHHDHRISCILLSETCSAGICSKNVWGILIRCSCVHSCVELM